MKDEVNRAQKILLATKNEMHLNHNVKLNSNKKLKIQAVNPRRKIGKDKGRKDGRQYQDKGLDDANIYVTGLVEQETKPFEESSSDCCSQDGGGYA